ncbi:MAG: restriction endonuclease subunit S [Bacteroidales bacterium]|nr:restriction endonuclease subunit S [Bacteroidales bacterium]
MEPKIRLKGFSGDWKCSNVGSECDVLTGFPFDGADICLSGDYMLMRGINITEGVLRHSDDIDRYYTGDLSSLMKYRLRLNDLVISMDGSKVGKNSALVTSKEVDSLLVQRVARLRSDEINTVKLLFVKISSGDFFDYVQKMKTASAIPHISPSDIKNFPISLPVSNEERSSLSNYFTNLDTLIQSTAKQLDKLRNIKAASLQSLFPQPGEKKPRVRFKGFEGDWKDVKVGDMGYSYAGLTGKTKDDFGCGDAKYITFMNVLTNAKVDTSILDSVCVARGERQNEVKKGDLLFNTSSETPQEVGFCCAMLDDIRNVYLNSFCFGFRLTDSDIDPLFISYLMRSNVGRRIMSILAQGATRYNLSKKNFMNTYLSIPSELKEQQKISEYLQSLDTQIRLQEQRLEKLRNIKSACLDNMFV